MKALTIQILVILGVLSSPVAIAIEKPEYEVIHSAGKVEFRRYASYIIAGDGDS